MLDDKRNEQMECQKPKEKGEGVLQTIWGVFQLLSIEVLQIVRHLLAFFFFWLPRIWEKSVLIESKASSFKQE